MVGGMAPQAFADLPPQSFGVLGGVPPEVFDALPPEVFGFGFGLFDSPPEFLGDAGQAEGNLDRLDALDAVGARMSGAANDLAAAVAKAEGFGAEMQAFGADHDQAKAALDAAQAAFAAAPTPARPGRA